MDIQKFIISENMRIEDAIRCLDNNGQGILFVCKEYKLSATISDGDIRRYILKNKNLQESISKLANYNPRYLEMEQAEQSSDFMKKEKITAVPIIDFSGRIVRIDFKNGYRVCTNIELDIPVVIMAGGKGTRLKPYTNILPKPLIPIGEKTITEHIIQRFQMAGCKKFYMIVNYKKNLIKAFFQENETPYDICYVDEEEFLGTGGGIKLLEGMFTGTFFMTNCDIMLDADYSEILRYHKESGNLVTMVCAESNMTIPYGTVEITEENKVVELREKPQLSFLTNTGFYLIESRFWDKIPENTFVHITDVIEQCLKDEEKIGVYRVSEHAWMDMGQQEELEKMRRRMEVE